MSVPKIPCPLHKTQSSIATTNSHSPSLLWSQADSTSHIDIKYQEIVCDLDVVVTFNYLLPTVNDLHKNGEGGMEYN